MASAVTLAALLMVRAPSLVVVPTAAVNVMLPVPAVRPRVWAPSRVLENVISPMPLPVLRRTAPVSVTALRKLIVSLW